ncbi:PucR family transcriptional regulator [Mycolicibacterium goodii]|uniref:PucR family transcriptional regulator n=1 Tax=Mycolicibacterium goodii TaxID=134601 RepID=UPI000C262903|nr:PucR family transcriptional regulator [Mycolicibacterium goodii]PJK21264.1 PucR family transcriptional regulator [Mycolicibacterium goodii]
MITAHGLTQVESLGLILVAGAQGANREITWAHANELPDPTPYLEGGELVMTTGINIGAGAAEQHDYVARLSAAGIAALAVDTGTTLREVPAAVLAAGDELGLPVLEVPASTPFIAIARVVIDAVKADELRTVQRVVDQQQVLVRATLRGGIPAVVNALAECLSAAVVVADIEGRILATRGGADQQLIEVLESARSAGARAQVGVIADEEGFVTVQSLRAAQPVRGHLAVRTEQPMSNSQRLLVAHAVSLISIELEKPARVVDAEERLRSAVTRDLLGGTGITDSAVLRYLGFQPDDEVVVLLLTGFAPLLTAQDDLGQRLSPAGSYLMASTGDELAIIVHAARRRRVYAAVEEFGRVTGRTVNGGSSRPVPLADAVIGAEQARIAAHSNSRRGITEFTDVTVFGTLLGGRSTAELRVLAQPLEPLLTGGDELIDALTAFLRHNGQLEAAASELRIHRHTMRNRMRRIGELLSDDLGTADTRAQLWLAIRAWQLLVSRERPDVN